jgi:hypothetical protein
MKKLIFLFLLFGCAGETTSIHRCDSKLGYEKDSCLRTYHTYIRHRDYVMFRGGGKTFLRAY